MWWALIKEQVAVYFHLKVYVIVARWIIKICFENLDLVDTFSHMEDFR